MNIDLVEINYLAVVVGVIVNMAGGALWYGPLFANPWMAENGFTREGIQEAGGAWKGYSVAIAAAIVSVFILALLIQLTGADEIAEGLLVGLFAGVGFIAASQASSYTFESRSPRLYLINIGYPVVTLAINGRGPGRLAVGQAAPGLQEKGVLRRAVPVGALSSPTPLF